MALLKDWGRRAVPRSVRNWVRAPGKALRWGWGELQYVVGRRQVREIRPGWRVVCHPLAYGQAYHAQQDDPDQIAEFDSFVAHCTAGMVLFDVGAHFGLFSLAAVHYGGPAARVLAVDASPVAVRMTRIQAALNGASDRVRACQACVCDQTGSQDMVAVGVLADGYFVAPAPHHTARDATSVPATTLDRLAEESALRPTHVKIDVEGYEASVLKGGVRLLSGPDRPVLFLELHHQLIRDRGQDPLHPWTLLEEMGYEVSGSDGRPIDRDAALARPLVRVVAASRSPIAQAK